MALVLRDGSTPFEYGVMPIFEDEDDDTTSLVVRAGDTMFECKKLAITATHAMVMSSAAELAEAHAQGSLKDSAKGGRQLAAELLAHPKLLSCISVVSAGKDNCEIYLHLTTPLDSTDRERSRNQLDRKLLRPLSHATAKAIRDNAVSGDVFDLLDDAAMKHLVRAAKLVPDEVKKGDTLPFRVDVAEGPAYAKLPVPWKK